MGVHLHLEFGDSHDHHPDWDWLRHSGDFTFTKFIDVAPKLIRARWDDGDMFGPLIRPLDVKVWREGIAAYPWPNCGRFEHMMDLLETNPNLWIWESW